MNKSIHIGCQKTGTTTLQKHLFSELDEVYYTGKYAQTPQSISNGIKGSNPKQGKKDWQGLIKRAKEMKNKKTIIYSSEGIVHKRLENQSSVAKNARAIFGNANILLTIRRQQDVLISQYYNLKAKGFEHDFETFFNIIYSNLNCEDSKAQSYKNENPKVKRDGSKNVGGYSTKESPENVFFAYKYDTVINIWKEYFDNIYILPLEAWKQSPETSKEVLSEFLGVEKSKVYIPTKKARSRSHNTWRLLKQRILPKYQTWRYLWRKTPFHLQLPTVDRALRFDNIKPLDNLFGKLSGEIEITKAQKSKINDIFSKENKNISNKTNFNLKDMGYPGLDND